MVHICVMIIMLSLLIKPKCVSLTNYLMYLLKHVRKSIESLYDNGEIKWQWPLIIFTYVHLDACSSSVMSSICGDFQNKTKLKILELCFIHFNFCLSQNMCGRFQCYSNTICSLGSRKHWAVSKAECANRQDVWDVEELFLSYFSMSIYWTNRNKDCTIRWWSITP